VGAFISSFFRYTAVLGVLSIPALVIARREGKPQMARRFLIATLVIGLICGVLAAGSSQLVAQCADVGNTNCVDFGTTGLHITAVVIFGATSLTRAYLVATD